MSSNAFARSRPRVRHQRVPRTHSCDHPRFLQLVNELARINEAKKKQEESSDSGSSSSASALVLNDSCGSSNEECTRGSSSACASAPVPNISGNNSCCGNAPQTSNSYRSLESNHSSSALHDSYQHYQQQQQPHSQQQNYHHHYHHHNHNHHHNHIHNHQNHHHHHQLSNHNLHEPQNTSNTMQHHQDDRCFGKTSSSTSNFTGYSKQNLVLDQSTNATDFTSNDSSNLDLRQDENRSKRKRPVNDLSSSSSSSSNSRKNTGSGSGSLKKHKSSSDTIRPLSPSFTKCPICLLDCMDRDPSFTNTCFHLFCYVCIENWTKNKATCPLCRTKFTKIIYNIKSATNYEEKIASPIRRDDDDGLIADRLMFDQLANLNSNTGASSRNTSSEEVQFLFENLRNHEVLMPQNFVNQMDARPNESLHFFNTVTTSANFNSNVPHPPHFTSTSYPLTPNYIALFHSTRLAPSTSTAITSAYPANTSLTSINTVPSNRRHSRSGRLVYSRSSYDTSVAGDGSSRASRASTLSNATSSIVSQPSNLVPVEHQHQHHHHHHHHQQSQHQHQHQSHHLHPHPPHNQHRASTVELTRQGQRLDQSRIIQLPYQIPRHYNPQPTYARRSYNNNSQIEHHLESLYRQMPDM